MGVFEQMPWTNFHGVNLAWILEKIRNHETRISALEAWKVVTDERLDTAEGDIDALEERMNTAESDIDALEGRMDTAENDIDALETQMPSSIAADAGKVLTATGAGAAVWRTPLEAKVYRITSANYTTPPDPSEIKQFYNAGFPVVLQLVGDTNICYNLYLYEVNPATESVTRGNVSFPDPQRMAAGLLANWLGQTAPTDGHVDIQIRKTNSGNISWWIGSIAA